MNAAKANKKQDVNTLIGGMKLWANLELDLEKWQVPVRDTQQLLADLGKDKLMEIYQTFKIVDADESGSITSKEFSEAMKILGWKPPEKKVASMLRQVDKNGNNELEFVEYVWLYLKYEQQMTSAFDNLKNTFQLMDEDGNGFVSTEEIKEVMEKFGQPMTEEEANRLLQIADSNHDGKIDYVEFARILMEYC